MTRVQLLCVCVVMAVSTFAVSVVHAQWATSPTVNTPVGLASNLGTGCSNSHPKIIPDDHGGVIVVWTTNKQGVRAERFDPLGVPQWGTGGFGVQVTSSNTAIGEECSVSRDGSGGAFVACTIQLPASPGYSPRAVIAQHVNSAGQPQWGTNGILAHAYYSDDDPDIASDGKGGAILVRRSTLGANTIVIGNRITDSGTVKWTKDFTSGGIAPTRRYHPRVASDGTGAFVVTWIQSPLSGVGAKQIFGQRFFPFVVLPISGGPFTFWTAGGRQLTFPPADVDSSAPLRLIDASWGTDRGCAVAWYDLRYFGTGRQWRVYATRFDPLGSSATGWTTAGVKVSTNSLPSSGGDYQLVLDRGPAGGDFFLAWNDGSMSGTPALVQRLARNGVPAAGWPTGGVVALTLGLGHLGLTAWNGSAGLVGTGKVDVRASRIQPNSTPLWVDVPVCTADNKQRDVVATLLPACEEHGHIIACAWTDWRHTPTNRTSPDQDVYAQAIRWSDGSLGAALSPNGPLIVAQPVLTTTSSGAVTMSVAATGKGTLHYRWFRGCHGRDFSPLSDGGPINGSQTPTLVVSPVNGGFYCQCKYKCVITDDCGSTETNSVQHNYPSVPMSITGQPANVNTTPGQAVVFNVAVSGTGPFTYQWFRIGCGPRPSAALLLTNSADISGVTTSTLMISPVSNPGTCGCGYFCRVTGPCGYQDTRTATLECSCVSPPSGMTLWLPLDESGGASVYNAGGAPNGTLVGHALRAPAKVANGLCLDLDGYVDVPSYAGNNPDVGDFSIDLWVQPISSSGRRVLVDKRRIISGNVRGYALWLNNNTLSFEMGDGIGSPSFTSYTASAPALPTSAWTHVAVTVMRNNLFGVRMYINGVGVPVVTNAGVPAVGGNSLVENGSLNNVTAMRIGAASTGTSSLVDPFVGCLDEIEFFRRVLTPSEVLSLAAAGSIGKCKNFARAQENTPIWNNATSTTARLQVCNFTPNTIPVLNWNVQAAPGGTVPGPTGFTPASGTVLSLLPGECRAFTVTIARPPGFIGAGWTSCFDLVVNNPGTGATFSARGSILNRPDWCLSPPSIVSAGSIGIPVSFGPVVMTNTQVNAATLPYRIVVIDPSGGLDASTVRLNGLPPGTPVTGTLTLAGGASAQIPLTASFAQLDPLGQYTVQLEQLAQDTSPPIQSGPIGPIAVLQGAMPPDCTQWQESFDTYPAGPLCFGGGWEPWLGNGSLCGTVSSQRAATGANSLKIVGAVAPGAPGNDMVHRFDIDGGHWKFDVKTYVPATATRNAYVIMLDQYGDPLHYGGWMVLDGSANNVRNVVNNTQRTPLVRDQWVTLHFDVDLDADTVSGSYNGVTLFSGQNWRQAISFPGAAPQGVGRIAAIALYGGEPGIDGTTGVWFDDLSLQQVCEHSCPADFNGDGVVDGADLAAFQAALAAGDLSADFNHDGQVDINDYSAFLDAYAAGCP